VEWSQLPQGVPGPPQRGAPQLGHVDWAVARCRPNNVPLFDEAGEEGGETLNPELLSNGINPCANTL